MLDLQRMKLAFTTTCRLEPALSKGEKAMRVNHLAIAALLMLAIAIPQNAKCG